MYVHVFEGSNSNVNVIAHTFSHKDVPSALVRKKVAHIVSNSDSNNEIESLGSSLTDDKRFYYNRWGPKQ